MSPEIRTRVTTAVLELGLLAVCWHFLGLDEVLVGAIALVIIAGAVVPPRVGRWVGGVGMLGLAALAFFYYGSPLIAGLLAVFGVVSLATGAMEARAARPL